MKTAEQVFIKALRVYTVPKGAPIKETKERYAKVLALRAARFYIDNHFDSMVVEEDLYPFCSKCGDDIGWDKGHCEDKCKDGKVELSNLDYSENYEKEKLKL